MKKNKKASNNLGKRLASGSLAATLIVSSMMPSNVLANSKREELKDIFNELVNSEKESLYSNSLEIKLEENPIKDGVDITTDEYQSVIIQFKSLPLIEAMEQDNLYYVANNMKNLLENVTLRKHNILIKIKEDMNRYGAVGSMMSGSGPSVFAFFDDMLKAQRCYEKMKENHREVFLTRTI